MSPDPELDIRWPIGLLFMAMGLLVAAYGAFAGHPFRPLGYNVDLWWGLIMLLFGLSMVAGAARARR
jgi:predicted Na+-dependent transporter